MIYSKTKLGIQPFDSVFGGIYMQHPTLIWGRAKTGKSLAGLHLIRRMLKSGECVLYVTSRRDSDIFLDAKSIGVDLTNSMESGQFDLLSSASVPVDANGMFPFPDALDDISKRVHDTGVSVAVFDPIMPWVQKLPSEEMPTHVEMVINAFSELGLTSLLIMLKPVSKVAVALHDKLVELCPIVCSMDTKANSEYILTVEKYMGTDTKPPPYPINLKFVPGHGFTSTLSLPTESADPHPSQPVVSGKGNGRKKRRVLFDDNMVDLSVVPASVAPSAKSSSPSSATPAASAPASASTHRRRVLFTGDDASAESAQAQPSASVESSQRPDPFAPTATDPFPNLTLHDVPVIPAEPTEPAKPSTPLARPSFRAAMAAAEAQAQGGGTTRPPAPAPTKPGEKKGIRFSSVIKN